MSTSKEDNDLVGVALVERDEHDDDMMTWYYPSLDPDHLSTTLIAHSHLDDVSDGDNDKVTVSTFTRLSNLWVHTFTARIPHGTDHGTLERVRSACVYVLTRGSRFNPERYMHLAKVLFGSYAARGCPVSGLLTPYLSAAGESSAQVTESSFDAEGEGECSVYDASSFDPRKAMLRSSIHDVTRLLAQEAVLLWTAMLLRKRIVVYAESRSSLVGFTRALPLLVWHRQDWSVIRPWLPLDDSSVAELKGSGVYAAGFTDRAVLAREDLFDIAVDIQARTVRTSEKAKNSFGMGKFHKDVANVLVRAASEEENVSDQAIIKEIARRTRELIEHIKGMSLPDKGNGKRSNMEKFCLNVALAEGIDIEGETED